MLTVFERLSRVSPCVAWRRVGCLLAVAVGGLVGSRPAAAADLPPELLAVKQQIIAVSQANTTRTDNIPAIRTQLDPLVEQLGTWFNANRPANEVLLTQVPWKNLWYDDPDIGFDIDSSVLKVLLDRTQIYQVVENGFYTNVSEVRVQLGSRRLVVTGYLTGAYTIKNPATPENLGQPRLNVVDLEFVDSRFQLGTITRRIGLSPLVRAVRQFPFLAIPVPGPIGVTGELWNVYVDEDLRIAAGFNDNNPEVLDLYILRKVTRAE